MRKVVLCLAVAAVAFASGSRFEMAQVLYKQQKFEAAYTEFNRACGEGEKRACTMNAIMLFNGDGVKADRVQAEEIFTKMCDASEGMACQKLAEMHAYGLTKDKKNDEERVRTLFKKACDLGYAPACDFVAK